MTDTERDTIPVHEHRTRIREVKRKHNKLLTRQRIRGDLLDLFGDAPPPELMTPYVLSPEAQKRTDGIQQKYVRREVNIRRAWNRTQRFLPELLIEGGPKHRVMELSTAHGAQLEIARHFGHEVMGCDYANMVFVDGVGISHRTGSTTAAFRALNDDTFERTTDDYGIEIVQEGFQDWPYRPICEAIDLPMTIFDGGATPYPFDDKSYDISMCFQAIEHYCHPDQWLDIIAEMCRITTKSIVLLLNPIHREYATDEAYVDSFNRFRLAMRSYNENGFYCSATFLHWETAHGFKLQAR